LFLEIPLQFLALWAAKRAFLSGKSLKTEVFRDSLKQNTAYFAVLTGSSSKTEVFGQLFYKEAHSG
jgi:hypothetical protein